MPSDGSLPPNLPVAARPYIGGQAVLEGVMMRAPSSFAIAVRRKGGELVIREREMSSARPLSARIPLVRGIHSLVESLRLGSEALRFSVEQMEEDVAPRSASTLTAFGYFMFLLTTSDADADAAVRSPREKGKKSGGAMGVMALFAVLLLVALPQAAAGLLNKLLHLDWAIQSPKFQAMTGVMKLTVVVGYMLLIRRVPEIRRVFQYHGAEHKTISTYEAKEALTVEHARSKTTLHPRCGTTFLVMVALVSVCVFTAVGSVLPAIHTGYTFTDHLVLFAAKLPFLPLVAGVTFELQRLFAKYFTRGALRFVLWPGFLVQKITTIEPDDAQLEVALASLRATLFREHGVSGEGSGDVTFERYEDVAAAERLRAA